MRTGMILAVVAACVFATACSKKSSSLYLVPGRAAEAQKPAAPAKAATQVEKASEVEAQSADPPTQTAQR